MKLFFAPLACSLAARIVLRETGAEATFVRVNLETKRTDTGQDFHEVNPLGLVPALEIAPGDVLSENAAVLQYLARRSLEAGLAPAGPRELARLQQWLCWIGTELHKGIFTPLLDRAAPPEAKGYALERAGSRFGLLERHLAGRRFLLDDFTVADAYLFAILNWASVTPIDLGVWPAVRAYHDALRERPSVARAFAEELELFRAERAQRRAADAWNPDDLGTAAVVERFNSAFLRHEPARLDGLLAEDCVLEDTFPAPDGSRHVGREACLEVWRAIARNRGAAFELEGVDVFGERAIIRWRYRWGSEQGDAVRGVNLMRVRSGRIVEAQGYVKAPA